MLPIEVEQLPPASSYLNYPRQGPPVGAYLGPNAVGEYVTVVSREQIEANWSEGPNVFIAPLGYRVGVAFGIYSVGGEPTDPDGFPPEVQYEVWQAQVRSDWQALKTPGISVQHRAGKPRRIGAEHLVAPVNDPRSNVKVTGIEP